MEASVAFLVGVEYLHLIHRFFENAMAEFAQMQATLELQQRADRAFANEMAERYQVDEGDDEWAFDEDMVEREREESVARLAIAREHLNSQEHNHRNILTYLGQQEEDKPFPGLEVELGFGIGSPSNYDTEGWGSQERQANARYVADEFAKRQVRMDVFQKSRMGCIANEKYNHEKLVSTHKAAEARTAQRIRQNIAEQNEKTFLAQQRRGEQQKMLKEIQRDQERQCDLLQAKHRPRPLPPLSRARAPKSLNASSSAGAIGEINISNEQIYKDLLQSHGKYNQEFERWEKRAQENERRTEAHRKKMLLTSKSKPEGKTTFKKAVKDIASMRQFVKRTTLTSNDGMEGLLGQSFEDIKYDAEDAVQDSDVVAEADNSGTPTDTQPQSTASRWRTKMQAVKLFHRSLDDQARQKLDRDVERLEQKRQASQQATAERSKNAAIMMNAWEEKTEIAGKRREVLGATNAEAVLVKRQEWQRNRDEMVAQMQMERARQFDSRRETINDVVSQNKRVLEDAEDLKKEKIDKKDAQRNQWLTGRSQAAPPSSFPNSPSAALEKAAPYKEKKAFYDKDHRRKATEEIQKKQVRHAEKIMMVRKPTSPLDARAWEGLEQQRRKPKYSEARSQRTPMIPPNMSMLKDPAASSQAASPSGGAEETDAAGDAGGDTPVQNESRTSVTKVDISFAPTKSEPDFSEMSQMLERRRSMNRVATAPASLSRTPVDEEAARSRSRAAGPDAAEVEAGSRMASSGCKEKSFLNELQAWSHGELRKIRRDPLDSDPLESFQ